MDESSSSDDMDAQIRTAVCNCDKDRWRRRESERDKRERLRTIEENQWKMRLLESAFDGDNHEIVKILKELSERNAHDGLLNDEVSQIIIRRRQHELVNCRDPNGNTPISEAAAGGQADTVTLLIEKGADPNIRGAFKRTPIYRAAFAGHLEVCQLLLRNGADPRLYADDGQTPEMVSSLPSIQALLRSWDLSVTDSMLDTIAVTKSLSETRKKQVKEEEAERLRVLYISAQVEWNKRYKEFLKAQHNLNEISESDDLGGPSYALDKDEAIKLFKAAEIREQFSRFRMDELHRKFSVLAIRVPDIDSETTVKSSKLILFRDLNDVLIRDVDGSIEASDKWPLVIDNSDQSAIFLRYCDTNFLDSYVPRNMEPETIRKALIGGIRYGKPVIVDLQGTDMFSAVCMKFNEVLPDLMELILTKEILKNEKYMELVKSYDGDDYDRSKFREERIKNFKFILLTKLERPSHELTEKTFILRVNVPSRMSISSLSISSEF